MITFDNDNCLIVLATHKMMRRHTLTQLKKSMDEEILSYLLGKSDNMTTQIIDRFIKSSNLKRLSRNIRMYISNKKLCVNEEQVLQVYFDKHALVSFLIDIKKVNRFLKTLTIKEMFTVLGIKDFMKLDLEGNSFYNVLHDKPEFFLKWKHV